MLNPIGPELWDIQYDHYMPLRILFRTRMTVFRLDDDALLLCSPIPIDDQLAEALAELGVVRWLLAPNLFHHMYLKQAAERYPDAEVIGTKGFRKKRPDIQFDRILDGDTRPPEAWNEQLDVFPVQGAPSINELLLFHSESGSLVCTDLVFNIQPDATNWITRMVLRMAGTWGKLAQSRLFASQVKDRGAYWSSLQPVLGLNVERLVMAHGDVVTDDALSTLTAALSARLAPPERQVLPGAATS